MKQTKWFDKKFDFDSKQNTFPSTLKRLKETPQKLRAKIETVPYQILTLRFQGTWSIKQNLGHLIDLEELWQGRLTDFLEGKEELRPWDLENTKTRKGRHNRKDIEVLLSGFEAARRKTIKALEKLKEEDFLKTALHPRLKVPMRLMDLFFFVAEHDDHHFQRIGFVHELFDNETFTQH